MTKQEVKKEVVLQMIWDRHFDLGMEKDLDDICEDIYNEVFVPLLGKARKETANEFYNKVNENICSFKLENKSQEFIDGYAQAIADICGRLDQVAKQYGVEVE